MNFEQLQPAHKNNWNIREWLVCVLVRWFLQTRQFVTVTVFGKTLKPTLRHTEILICLIRANLATQLFTLEFNPVTDHSSNLLSTDTKQIVRSRQTSMKTTQI